MPNDSDRLQLTKLQAAARQVRSKTDLSKFVAQLADVAGDTEGSHDLKAHEFLVALQVCLRRPATDIHFNRMSATAYEFMARALIAATQYE